MQASSTGFTIAIQFVQLLSENSGVESLLLTDSGLLRRFKIRGFLDQTGNNIISVLKGTMKLSKRKGTTYFISPS